MARHCPFCLAEVGDDVRTCPTDLSETLDSFVHARARSLLGLAVGTYKVDRILARGGMGEVYVARHPAIGREVAVKVLAAEAASSPQLVERFFAEARTVNVIRHENIVEVIDLASLPDGRPYLIMELLQGESLATRLRKQKQLELAEAGAIMLPVLDALGAAHAAGIVHRDLKPDNIYITRRKGRIEPKVLDFGIAKLTDRASRGGVSQATGTGLLLGTPLYMAPEQAAGRTKDLDGRSDVYAAGVILFEMLCGRPPFVGDAYGEILVAHITEAPPGPRALRPDLPEGVSAVVEKALCKKREQRWQSARLMAAALRRALAAAGVPARDLPEPTPGADEPDGAAGEAAAAESDASTEPSVPPALPAQVASATMNRAAAELMTHPPQVRPGGRRWIALGTAALVVAAGVVTGLTLLIGPGLDRGGDDERGKAGVHAAGDGRSDEDRPGKAHDDARATAAPATAGVADTLAPATALSTAAETAAADATAGARGSKKKKHGAHAKGDAGAKSAVAATAAPPVVAPFVSPVGPVSPEAIAKLKAARSAAPATAAPKK